MTNARYLAATSHGTPALRYARDRKGNNWTWTKADAYRFQTRGEAEAVAAEEANRQGGAAKPAVHQAPISPHKRQRRQTTTRMDS